MSRRGRSGESAIRLRPRKGTAYHISSANPERTMNLLVGPSPNLRGTVKVPPNKSHSFRA